jgi:hypothetical protein
MVKMKAEMETNQEQMMVKIKAEMETSQEQMMVKIKADRNQPRTNDGQN